MTPDKPCGLSHLYTLGALGILTDLELYTTSYGRSLRFMILFWFLNVASSTYMTFVLRPKLMNKLSVSANPTLADVITAIFALISGTSLLHNGLF